MVLALAFLSLALIYSIPMLLAYMKLIASIIALACIILGFLYLIGELEALGYLKRSTPLNLYLAKVKGLLRSQVQDKGFLNHPVGFLILGASLKLNRKAYKPSNSSYIFGTIPNILN